jgi:hypothetical protein
MRGSMPLLPIYLLVELFEGVSGEDAARYGSLPQRGGHTEDLVVVALLGAPGEVVAVPPLVSMLGAFL